MPRQLSLFPQAAENGLQPSGEDTTLAELPPVDEVLAATERLQNQRELFRLLDFIVRFARYSAYNGFLLYLQNPAAAYVATARTWSRKHKRHLKSDARPLLILAPMKPVIFVFDIADTIGPPLSTRPQPPAAKPSQVEKFYQNSIHNCALQAIAVRSIDDPGVESTVRITPALRKNHPELQLEKDKRYLVLLDSLNAMLQAATHVEEMAKQRWRKPRKRGRY